MPRFFRSKPVLVVCSLLAALLLGEGVVRLVSKTDLDGNTYLGARKLKPYRLPKKELAQRLEAYQDNPTQAYVTYNAQTGWVPTPNLNKAHGKYIHNAQGLRSDGRSYAPQADSTTLRIALLGDSYIYGDEVTYEQTLGTQLEALLAPHGAVEVLNFGVGAFGLDQAYLHWQHHASTFQPDVVVMGFQPENVFRNMNLVRKLYNPQAQVPFTKPRFIMEYDTLRLINAPTPLPQDLPGIMDQWDSWSLAAYESYYDSADYAPTWLEHVKLAGYVQDVLTTNRNTIPEQEWDAFSMSKEPALLALSIILHLKESVEQSGAKFYCVHLPRKEDLEALRANRSLRYPLLLNSLTALVPTIQPESGFVEQDKTQFEECFAPKRHYAGKGHHIVAEHVANQLLPLFEDTP